MGKYNEIMEIMKNEQIQYDSTVQRMCKVACEKTGNNHLMSNIGHRAPYKTNDNERDDMKHIISQLDKYIDGSDGHGNDGDSKLDMKDIICEKLKLLTESEYDQIIIEINRGKYSFTNRKIITDICKSMKLKYNLDISRNSLIIELNK